MTLGRQFEKFSGARQGVVYRGNGGQGTLILRDHNEDEGLFSRENYDRRHEESETFTHRHAESVEYGHHTPERKHDPTQWNGQMALPGMPTPTDPHLHRLRQANPHLNEFQFKVTPTRVTAHDAAGNRVGHLKLGYAREDFQSHEGHREVDELGVAPAHAGKGLGEAMYDLARMKGAKIVHSSERSESGEAFARRVGGPMLERVKGQGQDDYLGFNPPRHKV